MQPVLTIRGCAACPFRESDGGEVWCRHPSGRIDLPHARLIDNVVPDCPLRQSDIKIRLQLVEGDRSLGAGSLTADTREEESGQSWVGEQKVSGLSPQDVLFRTERLRTQREGGGESWEGRDHSGGPAWTRDPTEDLI